MTTEANWEPDVEVEAMIAKLEQRRALLDAAICAPRCRDREPNGAGRNGALDVAAPRVGRKSVGKAERKRISERMVKRWKVLKGEGQ